MKKIQIMLTVLCGVLISTLMFVQHNFFDDHLKFTLNLENIIASKDIDIQVIINQPKDREVFDRILKNFEALLDKHDIHGYVTYAKVSNIDDDIVDLITYYVTDNENYIRKNPLLTDLSAADILKLENWKISNNPKRENAFLIDFADKNRYNINTELTNELLIEPLKMVYKDDDILLTPVQFGFSAPINKHAEIREDVHEFYVNTELMESPMKYDVTKMSFDQTHGKTSIIKDATKKPYSVIWVSFLSIVVVGIYTSIKEFKEISISYLNGYSVWMVLKEYFIKFNLFNAVLMGMTLFLSSVFLTRSMGPAWLRYFKELINIYYYYLGFITISVLLSYFYLRVNFSSTLVKKNSEGALLSTFLLVLKIVFIIVFLVPTIFTMNNYSINKGYVDMYKSDPKLENARIIGFAANLNEKVNKDHVAVFNEFVYENKLAYYDYYSFIYSDFPQIMKYEDPLFGQYLIYDDFNIPYGYPYVIVNQKFLEDYKGLDRLDGSILIPSEIEKLFNNLNVDGTYEVYENNLDFSTFNYIDPITKYKNPIIIVDQNAFIKQDSKSTFFLQYGDDQGFENYLLPYSLEHDLGGAIKPLKDVYRAALEYSIESRNEIQYSMTILVVLMAMINLVTLRIFLDGQSKKLMVKYIHGYNFLNRFGFIVFSVLISSITGLILVYSKVQDSYGFHNSHWIYLSLLIIILELGILTYLIRNFEKKHIPSVIKGDAS